MDTKAHCSHTFYIALHTYMRLHKLIQYENQLVYYTEHGFIEKNEKMRSVANQGQA